MSVSPAAAAVATMRAPWVAGTLMPPQAQSSGVLMERRSAEGRMRMPPAMLDIPASLLPRRNSLPLRAGGSTARLDAPPAHLREGTQSRTSEASSFWGGDAPTPHGPALSLMAPLPPRIPVRTASAAPPALPTVRPLFAAQGPEPLPCAPYDWPEFNSRMGELCYLSVFPGDKRRDRCAQWLRELGLPYLEKDMSEICGAQGEWWVMSPTVVEGRHKKFKYGMSRSGQAVGIVMAHTSEATVAWLMRHTHAIAGCEQRHLHEQLTTLSSRRLTVQHFLHSLVLGELISHIDVLDLVNHHGKLYGVTPLHTNHHSEDLCALPGAVRSTLCRRMLLMVAKNLRDLHAHQAVHFNVCLDNIFFGLNEVALGGFSAAHFIGGTGLPSDRIPQHEPPEMVLDERRYSTLADIWGLGMTLMRLLAGHVAFLVSGSEPSERGLSPVAWQAYSAFYAQQTDVLGHRSRRGLRKDSSPRTPHFAALEPVASSYLQLQLSAGFAAASAADPELAAFVLQNMLCPSPNDRQHGDNLVSMAAALSRHVQPQDNDTLDDALEQIRLHVPGARGDWAERMTHISERWQQSGPDGPAQEAGRGSVTRL